MIKEVWVPIFLVFLGIMFLTVIPLWYSSCKAADIYNQQNNTNYTCSDFFWAAEQINSQTQTIKLQQ